MAQQAPNVIELYEGAVQQMLPTLAGVRADQLSASTLCTEWSVQNLITHNIKIADFALGIIGGNNTTTNPMEVGDPLPSQGARDAFAAGTTRVLDLLKSTSDLSQVIETPFGPMPIANFIMFPTLDIVLHTWDLAKGTGQSVSLDAGLSEACYGVMQMGAEMGRQAGAFGPEITVPITAIIQDKLLGISGRQP
jgi:uncharacterized protein (TIGR03086 family)